MNVTRSNITKNNFEDLPTLQQIQHEIKNLQPNQMTGRINLREQKALLSLMLLTGARITEILNLTTNDFILYNEKKERMQIENINEPIAYIDLKIETLKQRKTKKRIIPLIMTKETNELIEYILKQVITTHKQQRKIILNYSRVSIWRYIKKFNEDYYPHLFRAITITSLNRARMPLPTIARLVGHQNVNTTMIYTKINTDQIRSELIRAHEIPVVSVPDENKIVIGDDFVNLNPDEINEAVNNKKKIVSDFFDREHKYADKVEKIKEYRFKL